MTDKELLEAAATAYWGEELGDVCRIRWSKLDQAILYMHGDNQDHNGCDVELCWNPLEQDYDALRVAVKLNLGVKINGPTAWQEPDSTIVIWEDNCARRCVVKHKDDPYAATRRAIVRAAASIGQAQGDGK